MFHLTQNWLYYDTLCYPFHTNLPQPYPRSKRAVHTHNSFHASKPRVVPIKSEIWHESKVEVNEPAVNSPAKPNHTAKKRIPRSWLMPSEYLSDCLWKGGHALGADPLSRRGKNFQTADEKYIISPKKHVKNGSQIVRQSLQTILAKYILQVDPLLQGNEEDANRHALEVALSEVFQPTDLQYLKVRGYSVKDVVAWAWILTARDNYQASCRMLALEADQNETGSHVPYFIPLLLLKEQDLDPQVFRLLLIHSLHLLTGEPFPPFSQITGSLEMLPKTDSSAPRTPVIDVTTGMVLTHRLIHHARQIWPETFPVIAKAVARFLMAPNIESGKSSQEDLKDKRFRTKQLNNCLFLLSLPAKAHPFRSSFLQQQAQFELLRAMAAHKPVLPVLREGYRAVVAVQLAHKKTAAERQSADLKAPSWPPWKEERLGIDAQRGNEGLYSRAMNVLSQMQGAGYSPQLWEDISAILAGWDTDGSPTVQTRALAPPRQCESLESRANSNHHILWAARIRATRTVREAWACFLSYRDHGLPPKARVYAAMIEKLIFSQKGALDRSDPANLTLPGDGPEVFLEPESARDLIYVHTEPPSLDDFFSEMISHGIRPDGRLLALLLLHARNWHSGMVYLHSSNLSKNQILGLCTVWRHPSQYHEEHLKALGTLPNMIFGSFIHFLCMHSPLTVAKCAKDILVMDRMDFAGDIDIDRPIAFLSDRQENHPRSGHPLAFWQAIQLVKLRQPSSRWAWRKLVSSFHFGSSEALIHTSRMKRYFLILSWHGICQVFEWMRAHGVQPGPDDFHSLCVSFSRAVEAGIKQPHLVEAVYANVISSSEFATSYEISDGGAYFDVMVEDGLSFMKAHFDELILLGKTSAVAEQSIFAGDSTANESLAVPSLLSVPSYAVLHSYVRAMGLVRDDDGLLHLLRWMSRSAGLLNEAAEERLNGHQMMRQTLVAIRVYLQRLDPLATSNRIASDTKMEEAYDIVSRTPGWEWPDLAEVEEYLNNARANVK